MSITVLDKTKKESIMLIDIQYVRPNRSLGLTDYIYIIWKDIDSDEKHLTIIQDPKVCIYFEKPEKRNHRYNKNYEFKKNLDKYAVEYKNIIKAIVQNADDDYKALYSNIMNTGDYKRLKEIQGYPYVFGSDYDIRVLYRYEFKKAFANERVKHIRKAFGDIEVDSLESVGLPRPDQCPIDLITIIDKDSKQSYTFALVGVDYVQRINMPSNEEINSNPDAKKIWDDEIYKQKLYKKRMHQQEYWCEHIDELKEKAHDMFDENYPGIEYNFFFYKDELKMIVHVFQLIHKLKMDTLEFWNISFDIPYIMGRLNHFGVDPKDVMCHPDFPNKQCFFKKDNNHFDIKNKNDFFHCSSYTVYLDQMELYAQIRKGEKELRSNQLTYIAKREIGDSKLDYSDSGNIKTVSYKNYLMYILYNIKDVLLQVGIEEKTEDIDTLYLSAMENLTPYDSVFKQTMTLRAVQYECYDIQGLVPGNNINGLYSYDDDDDKEIDSDSEDDDEDTFEGALVGDPNLIDDFGATLYLDKTNNIFMYSVDEDMTAFYPNTIMSNNIDGSTLIFKCIVPSDQYEPKGGKLKYHGITDTQLVYKNKDSFTDDIGKEIQDNFQTGNYLSFGHKWLNLPSVDDVYKKLCKKLN